MVPRLNIPCLHLAHVCSGQTAGWINMPFGTEVWASVQAKKGAQQPLFGPYHHHRHHRRRHHLSIHVGRRTCRPVCHTVT